MTFEEGRALFPVLERLTYLNAGTFGPLARPVVEAVEREARRDLEQGRAGSSWFEWRTPTSGGRSSRRRRGRAPRRHICGRRVRGCD